MVGYAWSNALRSISTVATLTHPTKSCVCFVGWVSVGPKSLKRIEELIRCVTHHPKLGHMVGYVWSNGLRSISTVATLIS